MKFILPIVFLALFANRLIGDSWFFPPEVHKQKYTFGDVRIELIRDSTENQMWPLFDLLIYNNGELQAKLRNVSFENIYASEDNLFFAGLSNSGIPGTAFIVFDSKGRLLKEVKHRYSSLPYIQQSVTILRNWYKPEETSVRFVNSHGTSLSGVIVERKGMSDINLLSPHLNTAR